MDFWIQSAWAQTTSAPANHDASFINLVIMTVFFVGIFYFLLVRPQSNRVKEHKQMIDSLKKGDEIVTQGGLLGRITQLDDYFIVLEIAPNLEVKVQRQAVSAIVPKGTMKNTL